MTEPSLATMTLCLRTICGLFFIPHVIGKIIQRDAALNFFTLAGFRPVVLFANLALILDLALGTGLVLGLLPHFLPWLAMAYLLICAGAVIRVERKWLWHIGGCEYPVFWAACCGLVGYAQSAL